MKVKSESEVAQLCLTLRDPMDCMQPTRLLRPWEFPDKSIGVGCQGLLCETFAIDMQFPNVITLSITPLSLVNPVIFLIS